MSIFETTVIVAVVSNQVNTVLYIVPTKVQYTDIAVAIVLYNIAQVPVAETR